MLVKSYSWTQKVWLWAQDPLPNDQPLSTLTASLVVALFLILRGDRESSGLVTPARLRLRETQSDSETIKHLQQYLCNSGSLALSNSSSSSTLEVMLTLNTQDYTGRVASPGAGGRRGGNNYRNHRARHHHQPRGGVGPPAPSHRNKNIYFHVLKYFQENKIFMENSLSHL